MEGREVGSWLGISGSKSLIGGSQIVGRAQRTGSGALQASAAFLSFQGFSLCGLFGAPSQHNGLRQCRTGQFSSPVQVCQGTITFSDQASEVMKH